MRKGRSGRRKFPAAYRSTTSRARLRNERRVERRRRRRRRPRRRRRRISNRAQARALRVHARMRTELATHCWSSSDSSLVTSDTRPRLPQLRARTDRETRERCTVAPPRPACQSVHAFDASQ